MPKIKNMNDLGLSLLDTYEGVKDGTIAIETANALAKVAGKIINAVKVQLDYNINKDKIEPIELLESRKQLKAS